MDTHATSAFSTSVYDAKTLRMGSFISRSKDNKMYDTGTFQTFERFNIEKLTCIVKKKAFAFLRVTVTKQICELLRGTGGQLD